MFGYLIGDLDALEDCLVGGVVVVPMMASVCLALLDCVLANSRLGELDLPLDLSIEKSVT